MSEIIAAIIQAGATIVAALIAVLLAGRVIKKEFKPLFRSYSDKSHNLSDIIGKAKSDIFIVAIVGDQLLGTYGDELEKYLEKGIQIRYLLCDKYRFKDQEKYMHGRDVEVAVYEKVICKLEDLKKEYSKQLDVRIFHEYLTASYIGVDIWPAFPRRTHPDSIIQIMLYQYRVVAEHSPITYLSPESDRVHYWSTVRSIKEMWEASENL